MPAKSRKEHHKNLILRIKKDQNVIYNLALGIAVIGISMIGAHYIPQSAKAQENIQQYMILQKMTEMNDIAHKQRETLINALGSGYNMQRDRLFQVTDNKYHTAQYRDDKFKAAGKLHALMMQQNTLHQQIDKENSEQIKKCDQLEKEIELLLTK